MRNKDAHPFVIDEGAEHPKELFRWCPVHYWWVLLTQYGLQFSFGRNIGFSIVQEFEPIVTQNDYGGWVLTHWLWFVLHQWSDKSFAESLAEELFDD